MTYLKILTISILIASFTLNGQAQQFVFKKKLNKYIYKPKKGKADPQYSFDNSKYLSSGTWLVSNDGLSGIFNKDNYLVLPLLFEKIDNYNEESNLVKLNGEWGMGKIYRWSVPSYKRRNSF